MRATAAALVAIGLVAAGCGHSSSATKQGSILIVVDAPFSQSPYIGDTIGNGVQLAADQLNAKRLSAGGKNYRLRVVRLDNALSPARAVADTRRALREHATAIVTDGTGGEAIWRIGNREAVPIALAY